MRSRFPSLIPWLALPALLALGACDDDPPVRPDAVVDAAPDAGEADAPPTDAADDALPDDALPDDAVADAAPPTDVPEDAGMDVPPGEDVTPPPAQAQIRVLHLSPGAGQVDVLLDDATEPVVQGLAFGQATGYITVPAGSHAIRVVPAGQPASAAVLTLTGQQLDAGSSYSVVAYDVPTSAQGLVLLDDPFEPPGGQFRLRIGHLATGIGQIDVWNLTSPTAPLPILQDLDFGSVGQFIELPAGSYVIGLDVDDDQQPDHLFDLPDLAVGSIVNAFAATDEQGQPFLLLWNNGTTQAIQPFQAASLRFIHLAPGAVAIDAHLDQQLTALVENLAFLQGSAYVMVQPGTSSIAITPTGQGIDQAALTIPDLQLEPGQAYTVAVWAQPTGIESLVLTDSILPTSPDMVRLRPVHLAPGTPTADVLLLADAATATVLGDGLALGQAAPAVEAPAGPLLIGLDTNDDGTAKHTWQVPVLDAGTHANLFFVPQDGAPPQLAVQLPTGQVLLVLPGEPARVRFVHLSANSPAAGAWLDGEVQLATAVTFTQSTDWLPIAAGTHAIQWTAQDQLPANPLASVNGLEMEPGSRHTAVLLGNAGSPEALDIPEDLALPGPGQIRLQPVHAAPGLGLVSLWRITAAGPPVPLAVDMTFAQVGLPVELQVGPLTIGVNTDADPEMEHTFVMPLPQPGTIANLYVVRQFQGDAFLVLHRDGAETVTVQPAP